MTKITLDLNDTASQLQELRQFYLQTLLGDVVPFWFPRSIDQQHGGFLHCFNGDGTVVDTDKAIWAQGRMSWMLATLYNTVAVDPNWLQWAEQGVQFMLRHGFDQDGRMFFHVSQSGKAIRKRRYAYSEAFAAIACAALFQATGREQYQAMARKLFEQFHRWNFTPGLMPAKYTDTRPMTSIGPRMITIATTQALRASIGHDPIYQQWSDAAIEEIERLFVHHELQAVLENVSPEGKIVDHFDGRTLNPGHSIEAAWFILDEGRMLADQRLIELGCQMVQYSWQRGWDEQCGGLFYFRDVNQLPVQEYWHDMKFWWPHNEAIIATLMAYLLTGDLRFAKWHREVHRWSFQHFADPVHGEWWGYLHRDGRLSNSLKGNMWKSFFHHPRMLWKCWQMLSNSGLPPENHSYG